MRLILLSASLLLLCTACSEPELEPPYRSVAGVKLLMNSVLDPATDYVWDAVKTIMTMEETQEFRPETDEEWILVRNAAIIVAETGNLLMLEDRAMDGPDSEWMAWCQDMIDAGEAAMNAADAQDAEELFILGEAIYNSCNGCHATYWRGDDFDPPELPIQEDGE